MSHEQQFDSSQTEVTNECMTITASGDPGQEPYQCDKHAKQH